MSAPTLRLAEEMEDWEAILRLLGDAFAYMRERIDPPSSLYKWSPERMSMEAAAGSVILGEDGGELVACAFARPRGDTLYLGKIAVREDARGRGMLRRIIAMADSLAHRQGLTALELETRIELTENHAAFAALGFVKTAETAHRGFERPTSITMERPVGAHLAYANLDDAGQRAKLEDIIRANHALMGALRAARDLDLPDCWIVSGAIYNTVWNALTRRPAMHGVKDIDLFYFDEDTSWEAEDRVIRRGAGLFLSDPPVEIRNQARVPLWYRDHYGHDYPPITSSREAIDLFACRTHCVGARLEADDSLAIYAPYGLGDIFGFRLKPNTLLPNRATHEAKAARQTALWPELTVEPWPEAE